MAYRVIGWSPLVFPAPSALARSFGELMLVLEAYGERPLLSGTRISVQRLVEGFSISMAMGGLLGLAMWRSKEVDRFLGPLFLGLQTLPSVCWVPLGILLVGADEKGILFVLVMGSCFAIALALRDGLRTIPPVYRAAGLMLGANGWKMYRYVLVPASLPALAGSLRQGFSFAWRSLMGAELMLLAVDSHGLGFHLQRVRSLADVAQVVAIMVVMIVLGMAADRLVFARLQQHVQMKFGLA